MKLASFFALASNVEAYYYSKDFVTFGNFIPGPNVRIGEEMTYRSVERMWLNQLRDVNSNICDLNISLLGESTADISADFTYYFIIQGRVLFYFKHQKLIVFYFFFNMVFFDAF